MALDIPAVPVAGQSIKFAKAGWDTTRDGGGAGDHSVPSQQIPAGASILGGAYFIVDPFTDVGSTAVYINVGQVPVMAAVDPASDPTKIDFATAAFGSDPRGSMPVSLVVTGDGYSAGSVYIYVFYV